jgi:hypothetical protein
MRDHDPEECTESSGTMHQPAEATQQYFTSEVGTRVSKAHKVVIISLEEFFPE